jgi:hypothetical protein
MTFAADWRGTRKLKELFEVVPTLKVTVTIALSGSACITRVGDTIVTLGELQSLSLSSYLAA